MIHFQYFISKKFQQNTSIVCSKVYQYLLINLQFLKMLNYCYLRDLIFNQR